MSDDAQNQGEPSFAELFEASLADNTPIKLEQGQEVTGVILQIQPDHSFLDIGAKGEALISTSELLDEKDKLAYAEGETITARVVRKTDDGILVSRTMTGGGAGGSKMLEEAHQIGVPVDGMVEKVIKGGLEVMVAGVSCFCPASQISLRYVEDLSEFEGRKLTFRVSEYRDGGRSVVLSRKALQAEEKEKLAEVTREKLIEGAVLTGTVTNIREFGAFVDVGGIEGLLHISQISHARVDQVSDVIEMGQELKVQIVKLEGDRISLSLKSLEGSPWETATERFAVGTRHAGRVVRLQPYGAFVEIAPGVDGLMHVSTLQDPRVRDARRVWSEGEELEVVVVQLDLNQERVGLAPAGVKAMADAEAAQVVDDTAIVPGAILTGTVQRVEGYGIFVRLPGLLAIGGRPPRGLVPREELDRGEQDLKRAYPEGSDIRVEVLQPDEQGRIRLSQRAVRQAAERKAAAEYLDGRESSSGLGTLGDLLASKLKQK